MRHKHESEDDGELRDKPKPPFQGDMEGPEATNTATTVGAIARRGVRRDGGISRPAPEQGMASRSHLKRWRQALACRIDDDDDVTLAFSSSISALSGGMSMQNALLHAKKSGKCLLSQSRRWPVFLAPNSKITKG